MNSSNSGSLYKKISWGIVGTALSVVVYDFFMQFFFKWLLGTFQVQDSSFTNMSFSEIIWWLRPALYLIVASSFAVIIMIKFSFKTPVITDGWEMRNRYQNLFHQPGILLASVGVILISCIIILGVLPWPRQLIQTYRGKANRVAIYQEECSIRYRRFSNTGVGPKRFNDDYPYLIVGSDHIVAQYKISQETADDIRSDIKNIKLDSYMCSSSISGRVVPFKKIFLLESPMDKF